MPKAIPSVQLFRGAAKLNGWKRAAELFFERKRYNLHFTIKIKIQKQTTIYIRLCFKLQSWYSCIFYCLRLTFGPWIGSFKVQLLAGLTWITNSWITKNESKKKTIETMIFLLWWLFLFWLWPNANTHSTYAWWTYLANSLQLFDAS